MEVRKAWLHGEGVERVRAHSSWYGTRMTPLSIMAHYTATGANTAISMAMRRTRPRKSSDRVASWHVTVAQSGLVVQMVPFTSGAWHCARGTIAEVRGDLPAVRINRAAIGIELEGHGDHFPDEQVQAAKLVWAALVDAYGIERDLAMLEHSRFDPDRRRDPGPVWMQCHAGDVLEFAYPDPCLTTRI